MSTLSYQTGEWDSNRDCLSFFFGGAAFGQSSTTNNGNLTMQQHSIPDGNGGTAGLFTQQYEYDSLNRLRRDVTRRA